MKDYTDLTLPELTTMLKNRSLLTSGEKDTLVSRLEEYDHTNNPSPSPQLHHTPVSSKIQDQEPTQIPIRSLLLSHSDFLVNDEIDYANWEEAYGDDLNLETTRTDKTTISSSSPSTLKADPKPNSSTATPVEKSATADQNVSQSDSSPTCTYAPIEVTTKSGFKYKSLAATFYGDTPKVATKASSNTPPPGPPSEVPLETPIATIVIDDNSQKGQAYSNPHLEVTKTTKSGFKFNSIASLFSVDSTVTSTRKSSITPSVGESIAPIKQLPIESVVADTNPTYSSVPKLGDKDQQANILALRAKRFGIAPNDENASATKLRREARFGPSEISSDFGTASKNRMGMQKTGMEGDNEREREKARQRVSGSNFNGKRKRQDDNDRYHDREHRSNRQQYYRSPPIKNYGRHHRYT